MSYFSCFEFEMAEHPTKTTMTRRRFLAYSAGAGGLLLPALPGPARATPAEVQAEIRKVAGGATIRPGRIKLDLPVLVENGGAVPMIVSVTGDKVRSIHVFAEGNPNPNVANFHFGPLSGRPRVATRIRLATSQTVIAIAKLEDGSCWSDSVDLIVTIAACLE